MIYTQDETSLNPYCVSISMYPFLLEGMTCFGDENASGAPTHLRSFCGSYVNMVQHVAGNFAGAVATIEFLYTLITSLEKILVMITLIHITIL